MKLRKQFIKYGKIKLLIKYRELYPEDKNISEWKMQRIIQILGIYYCLVQVFRIANKQKKTLNKKRISELKKKPKNGYLLAINTIIRIINGQKRYIITAIGN